MRFILFVSLLTMALFGCGEKPITEASQGNRNLPQAQGRITAREALELIHPVVMETSRTPVLVLVTSGTDVTIEGRSATWEFVYHFPARMGQGSYSLEPVGYETSDSPLRLAYRLSPRGDARSEREGLALDFIDSPQAARNLAELGADWISGDPDMILATKRLPSGAIVWATESYGMEYTTAFEPSLR